ncbi:DUF969 domain-containing protein [Clostridium botulinum]|uniref:DUF969 domain-containing protein n=1 Tax=Clostridium botulinum TaxID=1491 RepID=UPI00178C87F1|nr:DUF969 domain-containing protein [Clostridium botulinum]MBZ1329613.1 DUF969 domain-containing protein [Clostridium botulinum]MBZ1333877.1 DUF969 domain-containing protein [Clostridium botulinum]MBZ1336865.1 DUF969 domain-containing protein [Clostridium botulinum]MBZ1340952.1 DUF969 domain-containing protein [Clostridium botulinum]MBZ1343067.1 DUF969 domain-containing protein [Clostridium botulinum]
MKLIGVLIVVLGFALKLDIIAVVLVSGLTTGLVAGLSFTEILDILGKSFVETRYMTLFLLTLPVIGICERYGLREMAIELISKAKNATTGKILNIYALIREVASAMSLRLGGHPQFVRPLINPMSQGAAISKYGEIDEEDEEKIKAQAAAMDNYGNFFGQNVFIANAGVLLIVSTLEQLNYKVDPSDVAKASIPIAICTIIVVSIFNYMFDKKLQRKYKDRK